MSKDPPLTPPTPLTYRRIGALLHETGLVSAEKTHSVLGDAVTYADDELDHAGAAGALVEFGAAVAVHGDDIDSIHEDYAGLLAEAAEIAGGQVTITDVRIDEGEGGYEGGRNDNLEFKRNGVLVSLMATHFAEDYYDHETACRGIAATAHDDDPRSWRNVEFAKDPDSTYDSIMVLATPAQADALHEHLGFTLY
ncbi:hypothetical protein [Streptomyces sp. NPDC060022]|uniref:hypothetical protein n=1 Tax=Streptomyces sp. NPDC060022 TaxID=3347039 RepID=UPI0036D0650E